MLIPAFFGVLDSAASAAQLEFRLGLSFLPTPSTPQRLHSHYSDSRCFDPRAAHPAFRAKRDRSTQFRRAESPSSAVDEHPVGSAVMLECQPVRLPLVFPF